MRRLALTALLLGTFLVLPASAQLQYFGYVNGADEDTWIEGTKSYTNWSWLVYTPARSSTWMAQRLDALAQRDMKAILELGQLLWNPANNYTYLYPDYLQRWNAFRAALHPYLSSGQVIAVQIRDEPFLNKVWMPDWEIAAQMIRRDYPNIKILLVEAADIVADPTPSSHFNRYKNSVQTVDWICAVKYGIKPATNQVFRDAVNKMKWTYPNRKFVYAADGFWGNPQKQAFGVNSISYMREIMQQWYDVARADSSAVLLGVFIFGPLENAITSKDFPCDVLSMHVQVGRAITGRVRPQTSLPIGRLESISHGTGLATGWACDPDGALCETPRVDFYVDGGYQTTAYYPPNGRVESTQCRTGVAYRFQQGMVDGNSGRRITAYARDLDAGGVTLPSNCPDNPACIFYTTNHESKGYMQAISPTGIAGGWACDPDAPHLSTKVRLATEDGTLIGVYTANQGSEQAIANECGGGSAHRFSTQLPPWARYHDIYAYSQDLVSGEVQIPWLCEQGWFCTWW